MFLQWEACAVCTAEVGVPRQHLAVTALQGGFLESLAEDPMAQKRTKITLRISDFCYLPGNVALERAVCSAG